MKKKLKVVFLLVVVVSLVLVVYNKVSTATLPVGTYELSELVDGVKPVVKLQDNQKFIFMHSRSSSYMNSGTYEVQDGKLTLKTADGKYVYVFKIMDKNLVFNSQASVIPSFEEVRDGAIFELSTKS